MHDQSTNTTQPIRLIPIAEVSAMVGMGVSTIWERTRRKAFPQPVRIGPRTTRWVSSEVKDWCDALIAGRA